MMSGDMSRAWKKAEEIISYAIPEPWIPEGHAEIQMAAFPLGWTKGVVKSLLGGRGKPSLVRAADAFNAWARNISAHLEIMKVRDKQGRVGLLPEVKAEGTEGFALWMVWRLFFIEKWKRLKRCPQSQCRKWFVDQTHNGIKVRCSTACTNRWWTLARRRKAGHDISWATRKAKRRVKP